MGMLGMGNGEAWGRMVKSYQAQLKQKAELGIIMKSGWVESGRRTTLLCHLFCRWVGRMERASYSQPSATHRTSRAVHDAPAAHGRPKLARTKTECRYNYAEHGRRRVLAIVDRRRQRRGAGIDALCCGSASRKAMMQVRRRKSGGACTRGRRVGGGSPTLTSARYLPDRGHSLKFRSLAPPLPFFPRRNFSNLCTMANVLPI